MCDIFTEFCNNENLKGFTLSFILSENEIDENGITLLLNTLDSCKNIRIKNLELSIDRK